MLYPQQNEHRNLFPLDGIWDFRIDENDIGIKENWHEGFNNSRPIAVPSSWNELYPDTRDYIGVAWYQTKFKRPRLFKSGNLRLRFGAVTYKATIWLNGILIGSHEGGFLPFEFNIDPTSQLVDDNRLVVRVENELKPTRVPPGNVEGSKLSIFMSNQPATNYDFFPYSGIHRSVVIYQVPKHNIADVTVNTSILGGKATVTVAGLTSNGGDEISFILKHEGTTVEKTTTVSRNRFNGAIDVDNPHLWSTETPYMYQLELFLKKSNEIIDSYYLDIGIRTIEVKDSKIILNGNPIELKGFGRHEDSSISGRGQNLPQSVQDHNLMTWIGANSYRTAHYPYSEEDLTLANKNGFLVIDEIPAVGLSFEGNWADVEERLDLCRQQISELIMRDKNHPSVIMWSIANEPFPPNLMERAMGQINDPIEPSTTDFLNTLIQDAKTLDETRPVSFAGVHGTPLDWLQNVDVVMLNRYNGWYFDQLNLKEAIEKLSKELDHIHSVIEKPIIISEFGADTVAGLHAVSDELYSEEYQVDLLKAYLDLANSRDYLVGMHVWNLADFRTSHSMMRIGGLNRKGVFTRDRTPKMGAHFLRSRWT